MIDLTTIIQAVLALLAALITYKLIPWIKAKTNQEQQNLMLSVTSVLVFAAEQLYGAGRGADKLDYVVRELENRGFTADRAAIEAVIKDYADKLQGKSVTADGNADGQDDAPTEEESDEDEEPPTPDM